MKIDEHSIDIARQLWSEWAVKIGKTFLDGGDYFHQARQMIYLLYGYNEGVVLFKPTKAKEEQFRLDAESAVSYMIGGNDKYPEDHGFLLKPWINVRFENAGYIFREDYAITMGNYFFMNLKREEIKVEYTLGYFRSVDGSLKINLHHSSLPYSSQ
jgi:hypothetical protein